MKYYTTFYERLSSIIQKKNRDVYKTKVDINTYMEEEITERDILLLDSSVFFLDSIHKILLSKASKVYLETTKVELSRKLNKSSLDNRITTKKAIKRFEQAINCGEGMVIPQKEFIADPEILFQSILMRYYSNKDKRIFVVTADRRLASVVLYNRENLDKSGKFVSSSFEFAKNLNLIFLDQMDNVVYNTYVNEHFELLKDSRSVLLNN